MKLTKFDHACFVVEKEDRSIIVDPGNLTPNLQRLSPVEAIIITHQHADHFDPQLVRAILNDHPMAQIYTTADVAPALSEYNIHIARPDEHRTAGPFSLRFYGELHARIHDGIEPISNIGVLIDEQIYYPGDALTIPDHTVTTLLLPVAAPWIKISESLAFAGDIRAPFVIPTHDAILTPAGKQIIDGLAQDYLGPRNITYRRLTQPIEIT